MKAIRIFVPLTTITDTFYMACCRECGSEPGFGIPFDAEIDRDEWDALHAQATGHHVDRYIELHGRGDDGHDQ